MTLHVFCFNSHKCIALSLILATVFVTDSRGHCPHGCVCSPNSRHAQLNHLSCAHANADDIRPSQHTHSLNYKSVFTSYIDASHFPTEPNNLIFLSWTDSGIKSIKSNALQYLINLRSLNLSNNDITTLNNALRHLDNLQSLNLTNNKLKRLSYFDIPEASLESLFLANNLLYDDCFLRGEQSDGVCLESPRPRKKLSSLDLSTNSLSEFHGYPHCENLVELDLSFNRISFISEVFLVNLFRLNRLDISHNALKRLLQPMLKNAVLLERLDASDNEVTEISENFFRNLESLRILNLSNNPIQTLPSRGFQNCHWLHTLSIDNSSISYVPHDFFYGLEELTDLSLKHNKFLSFIPENSFAYSTHLEYLDLRSNNLTVLPKSISLLSKLKRIFLYGNPISCNCSLAWYVGWQERYSIENDHNSTICSHLFNETKSQNFSCIETPILPRLMFELGRAAMLDCGHAIRGSNISWVSPSGLHYNSFISIWNTKSALDVPTVDDSRIKLLENGSLYIKHILRGDCGLYICRVNDAFLNYSSYFVVQLDPITYYRIKIQSIVVGLGSAFGFLAITIVVQIIRKLCKRFGCCASDNEDEDDDDKEGNQLPQVLESIEQYKTQQLERLRENYTIQAHKIKENCVTQVEWICDSYQNQVKNLKDFRDYGTSHISSMKEQYYEQVKRVKEYSNGQLTWVRENYVFQRNRVRKFSSHKVLRFRESYKYQQQALNKVLENLPSLHLDNCRSGSCSKEGDAPTEAEDPDFEVYIKTAGSSIIHPLTIFEDSNECQSVYYTPSEFSESPMTPARDKSSRKLSLIPDLIKSDERVLERKIYSAIPKCNNDISRVGRSHDRRSTDMSNVHVRIAPLRASSMPEIKKSSEQTPLVDQADIFYESNCDNGEVSPVKVRNETAL